MAKDGLAILKGNNNSVEYFSRLTLTPEPALLLSKTRQKQQKQQDYSDKDFSECEPSIDNVFEKQQISKPKVRLADYIKIPKEKLEIPYSETSIKSPSVGSVIESSGVDSAFSSCCSVKEDDKMSQPAEESKYGFSEKY